MTFHGPWTPGRGSRSSPGAHRRRNDTGLFLGGSQSFGELVPSELLVFDKPLGTRVGLRAVAEINVGEPDNYRLPDAALTQPGGGGLYNATAALAVEVLSPEDETWNKLPF